MSNEYLICIAECASCSIRFGCNPIFVPSITIEGKKEAICKSCFERWNKLHRPKNPLECHPRAYSYMSDDDYHDGSPLGESQILKPKKTKKEK